MIYEFPKWVKQGAEVIDTLGDEWIIVDWYVTGNYASDWGVLQVESVYIPGFVEEFDVYEVHPKNRIPCKRCGLPEFTSAHRGEASCGCA